MARCYAKSTLSAEVLGFIPLDSFLFYDELSRSIGYNPPILISMGTHMKTTIEVSDSLFASAKNLARERKISLRALVEDGLRRVLSEATSQVKPAFKLKDARVHGQEVLLPNPCDWQQLEEDHALSRNIRSTQ
jgi:hypothetical protein